MARLQLWVQARPVWLAPGPAGAISGCVTCTNTEGISSSDFNKSHRDAFLVFDCATEPSWPMAS